MKFGLCIFLSLSFVFLCTFGVSCVYGYFFPLKYEEEIASASETFDVDPVLVASIINSESGFNSKSVSKKGAIGLMQLMPSTAEYLAEKLNYGEYDLYNVKDNITLGTYYLSILSDSFNDNVLVLCSYNAGPGNVSKWLQEYSSDGETLDKIPFKETENYVKKCQRAMKYYAGKRSYFKVEKD